MSSEQHQRTVNRLDNEIADLEKKKAAADKKAADEARKAANISISKNASTSTIKSKMNARARHNSASNKAAADSADFAKRIADKRKKRNDAYKKLQNEQNREKKKERESIKQMQKAYEKKVSAMAAELIPQRTIGFEGQQNSNDAPEYDVFVSHAWEDKEGFVDELVDELRKTGLTVWYDTDQMKVGDSMRERIDDGLKKSRFGIVVLSPNYIADGKYWTKTELNGLFQLESVNGKMILPIWHNLTKKDVMDFSSIIADKKALTTDSMTAHEIANEIATLLRENSKEEVE